MYLSSFDCIHLICIHLILFNVHLMDLPVANANAKAFANANANNFLTVAFHMTQNDFIVDDTFRL